MERVIVENNSRAIVEKTKTIHEATRNQYEIDLSSLIWCALVDCSFAS